MNKIEPWNKTEVVSLKMKGEWNWGKPDTASAMNMNRQFKEGGDKQGAEKKEVNSRQRVGGRYKFQMDSNLVWFLNITHQTLLYHLFFT